MFVCTTGNSILFQSSFFHKGSDKLNAEFKTILDKYNTPILPVVLLDLIHFEGKVCCC